MSGNSYGVLHVEQQIQDENGDIRIVGGTDRVGMDLRGKQCRVLLMSTLDCVSRITSVFVVFHYDTTAIRNGVNSLIFYEFHGMSSGNGGQSA